MTIPTNYTFVATYTHNVNGNLGAGNLIGSSHAGAAVLNYQLDLNHNDYKYVDYAARYNADSQQTGAIKFVVIPNYSGIPATSDKIFITICKVDGSQINLISVVHSHLDNNLYVFIFDNTGTPIFNTGLGVWNPVQGLQYEFELNWDITAGASRLFVNGKQFGATITATGVRNSSIGLLRVGGGYDSTSPLASNFGIEKLIIFNTVQNTADYTPGYCLGWAEQTMPTICSIYGFVRNPDNSPVSGIRVHAYATQKYEYGNLEVYLSNTETLTEAMLGGWMLQLIENTTTNIPYTISFYQGTNLLKEYTNIIVPNTTNCIAFTDLI